MIVLVAAGILIHQFRQFTKTNHYSGVSIQSELGRKPESKQTFTGLEWNAIGVKSFIPVNLRCSRINRESSGIVNVI